MRAVVVGGGLGGLAVSIRLAAAGHDVTLLERNDVAGGKIATLELDGYRFDLGPAYLTQPALVDELLHVAGTSLADEVSLTPLDPHASYRWVDGSSLAAHDDDVAWRNELERFSPGGAAAWERFAGHADEIWQHAREHFLTVPQPTGRSLLGRWRSGFDLKALDGRRSLADLTRDHFDDPRLQQLVNHVAIAAGSSPYRAPATFAHVWAAERAGGVWHVTGGMGRLRDALVGVAERLGVDLRCGVDVGRIVVERGAVAGISLADGGGERADVVVAGVDAGHLYTELLPDPKRARELDRAKRSTSGFLLCAAVRGRTEGIEHRTVWFPLDDRAEYQRLEVGFPAIDPTVTTIVSAATDPSMAPRDAENWYVLVHLPPATGVDRKMMTASVLNRLAERGVDLRHRIEYTRTLLPADVDARYRAIGGAFHGTSTDGVEATFGRPSNVGPVDGLFLVGGSAHPGGGVAPVLRGAAIVADLVAGQSAP